MKNIKFWMVALVLLPLSLVLSGCGLFGSDTTDTTDTTDNTSGTSTAPTQYYSVKLHLEGGIGHLSDKWVLEDGYFTYTYSSSFTAVQFGELPTAQKTNYVFAGWYSQAEGGTKLEASNVLPNLDTNFYAHWKVKAFSIENTYYSTFAEAVSSSQSGDVITISEGSANINSSSTITLEHDLVIQPSQDANVYVGNGDNAIFDLNGNNLTLKGNLHSTLTFGVYDRSYDLSWNPAPTIVNSATSYANGSLILKNGFEFEFDTDLNVGIQDLRGEQLSLTLDTQGGTGTSMMLTTSDYVVKAFVFESGVYTCQYRKTLTSTQIGTLPTPTKAGYQFSGWYTTQTGGTRINSTHLFPSSSLTFYAQWELGFYFIGDTPYSSLADAVIASQQGDVIEIRESNTNVNGGTPIQLVCDITIQPADGQDIYISNVDDAIFEMNGTRLILQGNGTGTLTFGVYDRSYDPTWIAGPTIDNQVGHYQDSEVTLKNGFEFEYETQLNVSVNDQRFDAVRITLMPQGGTGFSTGNWVFTSGSYTYEYAATMAGQSIGMLPVPTRGGYVFKGWYTDVAAGIKINSSTPLTENQIIYYAQWGLPAFSIDGVGYETLVDAVAASYDGCVIEVSSSSTNVNGGDPIVLICDITIIPKNGKSIVLGNADDAIFDMNGHNLTLQGNGTGTLVFSVYDRGYDPSWTPGPTIINGGANSQENRLILKDGFTFDFDVQLDVFVEDLRS